MTLIRKKTWPEYFNLVKSGKKRFDSRVADFKIKKGDTLVLEEWDPRTKKFTGRSLKKKVKSVLKTNPLKFYSVKELKKGMYWIQI